MRHKPVVKLSRSINLALTDKAARLMERRPYPPGEHGRRPRRNMSSYKERLLEKQRLRFQYHVSEKQLRKYYDKARRQTERTTGDALIGLLESRLDALVLRSGFAKTIYQARQFVSHGHILVNGKRIDRPSFHVLPGTVISVHAKSQAKTPFEFVKQEVEPAPAPTYIRVDRTGLTATLEDVPSRALIPVICNEQFVVEFYAR
jgi:small subunit ribosomal protein S4